jgi:hypothetical protein
MMPAHKTAEAQITTDHDQIRKWADSRGGKPAAVKATQRGKDPGIIRLIFPGAPYADDGSLEEISWEEFFRKFEDAGLALLYQDKTSGGKKSLFSKLIGRETAEARHHGEGHASRHRHG